MMRLPSFFYLDALVQALSKPVPSEAEMEEMTREQQSLIRAISALEEKKRAQMNNPDDKLALFRQQANLVSKKKEQLLQRLNAMVRERSDVDAELASRAVELKAIKGKVVPMGEDFQKYAAELRSKTALWKRMKGELAEVNSPNLHSFPSRSHEALLHCHVACKCQASASVAMVTEVRLAYRSCVENGLYSLEQRLSSATRTAPFRRLCMKLKLDEACRVSLKHRTSSRKCPNKRRKWTR